MFQRRKVATAAVPMIAQPIAIDRSRTRAVIWAERAGNSDGREAISTDRTTVENDRADNGHDGPNSQRSQRQARAAKQTCRDEADHQRQGGCYH